MINTYLCPKCMHKVFGPICYYCTAMERSHGYRTADEALHSDPAAAGDNGARAGLSAVAPAGAPTGPIPQPGGGAGGLSVVDCQRDFQTDTIHAYFSDGWAAKWDRQEQRWLADGTLRGPYDSALWGHLQVERAKRDAQNYAMAQALMLQRSGAWTQFGQQMQQLQQLQAQSLPVPLPAAMSYPPPAKPIEDGGIIMGEIIGWRCWRVRSTGALQSISHQSVMWTPGKPMTVNDGPLGNADMEVTTAGVHAWKDKAAAMRYGSGNVGAADVMIIVGSIKLSGQVLEHEKGYRAEFGEIASLDFVISDKKAAVCEDVLKKARAMYGLAGDGGYIETNEAHAAAKENQISGTHATVIIVDDPEDEADLTPSVRKKIEYWMGKRFI